MSLNLGIPFLKKWANKKNKIRCSSPENVLCKVTESCLKNKNNYSHVL